MKSLEYNDIFGKTHTHVTELRKSVKFGLIHIIMDEKGISEKAFEQIDQLKEEVDSIITENDMVEVEQAYQSGKRLNLIYELLYDKLYNKNTKTVNESVESVESAEDSEEMKEAEELRDADESPETPDTPEVTEKVETEVKVPFVKKFNDFIQ